MASAVNVQELRKPLAHLLPSLRSRFQQLLHHLPGQCVFALLDQLPYIYRGLWAKELSTCHFCHLDTDIFIIGKFGPGAGKGAMEWNWVTLGGPSPSHPTRKGCLTQQLFPLSFLPCCLSDSRTWHPWNSCGVALARWLSWLEHHPTHQKAWVRFRIRTYT